MGVPIGFEPDFDTTPDADLLGYGWLHYDDGTSPRWLNGDAETAALVGRYQDHVQDAGVPSAPSSPPSATPPAAPPDRGPTVGSMIGDAASSLLGKPNDPTRFSNYSNQNLFGGFSTAAAPGGAPDPTSPSSPEMQAGAVPQAPAAQPAPAPPSQVDMTGQSVSNPSSLPPPPAAPPGPPMSPDGLQLFERQGRLDPDVAARQAQDRSAENQRMLEQTQTSRDEMSRINRGAYADERDRQQAIFDAQQKQAQDALDRVGRYQQEQQLVNDAQIHHDLVSAQGPGAILTVVGAALLGATGSQEGLKMINSEIDRYVKTQLQQKDSKLRILADQIGNDRQVAAMATSRYLEAAQKHAEMLQKLAGADAFDAQTPLILEGMKQTQLANDQKAEEIAMGKTTEKAPVNKGADPKMLEKLGKVRRERQGIENIVGSAEQAIGLVWDPKLHDYVNGDEKIKAGFQGSGALEHWVPNAVYPTLGDTTAEGYRVIGAARALAYAKSQQMQPGSRITKEDVEDGVKAGGFDTERGFVNGLRQMRLDLEKSKQLDVGQYGPEVVNQFERNYRGAGGVEQSSSPGAAQPASLETKQAALDQLRTGKAMAQDGGTAPQQGQPANQGPSHVDDLNPVGQMLGQRYDLNWDAIKPIIKAESGGNAQAMNHAGGGSHGGLIGFDKGNWPAVAKAAGHPDVSYEEAMKLPPDQQLDYVFGYMKMHGLSEHSDPKDYALATALPWAIGKDPDEVVGEKGSTKKIGNLTAGQIWEANAPWRGPDGKITPASILHFYGY